MECLPDISGVCTGHMPPPQYMPPKGLDFKLMHLGRVCGLV